MLSILGQNTLFLLDLTASHQHLGPHLLLLFATLTSPATLVLQPAWWAVTLLPGVLLPKGSGLQQMPPLSHSSPDSCTLNSFPQACSHLICSVSSVPTTRFDSETCPTPQISRCQSLFLFYFLTQHILSWSSMSHNKFIMRISVLLLPKSCT